MREKRRGELEKGRGKRANETGQKVNTQTHAEGEQDAALVKRSLEGKKKIPDSNVCWSSSRRRKPGQFCFL